MFKATTKHGDTARGARCDVGGGHRGRIPLKTRGTLTFCQNTDRLPAE